MSNNFLDTPKRSVKPRDFGINSMIDNGVPTRYFKDVIESNASLIDFVKFCWCTALVTKDLEEKIECLANNHVEYYFGGTLFEKALSQNKLDAFYQFLKNFNCRFMEVSDGTLTISSKDKARHIANFAKEFCVFSEVGKKDIDEADNMPISRWIDEIHSDLAAGASKVILESRESGKSGICDANGNLRPDLVASITKSRFRAADALWEAPNKMLQTSLISTIGPNVNLANIAFGDIVGLETLRLGIRSDTFNLFNATGTNYAALETDRAPFEQPDRRGSSGQITDRNRRARAA